MVERRICIDMHRSAWFHSHQFQTPWHWTLIYKLIGHVSFALVSGCSLRAERVSVPKAGYVLHCSRTFNWLPSPEGTFQNQEALWDLVPSATLSGLNHYCSPPFLNTVPPQVHGLLGGLCLSCQKWCALLSSPQMWVYLRGTWGPLFFPASHCYPPTARLCPVWGGFLLFVFCYIPVSGPVPGTGLGSSACEFTRLVLW